MNSFSENQIISLFSAEPVASLDDCSDIPGTDQIVSTDSLCENVHFRLDWSSPEQIASKAVQVNISDVAVSGGRPQWALLNLGIPPYLSGGFLERFSSALKKELSREGVLLIGGDTYRSGEFSITLTVGGKVIRRMHRSGGNPGDILFVTGSLGLSMLGYKILKGESDCANERVRSAALAKHLAPEARRDWAQLLAENEHVRAAMDITDGLLEDASRLAAASKVTLLINADSLPKEKCAEDYALYSGEELEILFLASADFECPPWATKIGQAVEYKERTDRIIIRGHAPSGAESFSHFKKNIYD